MTNQYPKSDPRELALNLANGRDEPAEHIVERAKAYLKFLTEKQPA